MGIIRKIRDAGRIAKKAVIQTELGNNYRFSQLADNYGNMFAQVRPLVDEMKAVRPYGVGKNGAKLPMSRTPELAVLNNPNEQMGWADLADLMFTSWLTEDELDILVHHDRKRVYGYTILPAGSKKDNAGRVYFEFPDNDGLTQIIGPEDVMRLRFSRSPQKPGKGVSPASSVYVYAQIDDLLAQYQRAFFENGARPETIMIIKASTREKFEEKQRKLEEGFRGANNRNKTLFLWHQFLPDGSEADEVEVKTIQGNNSTLALKEISEIISDRLNKSVGVSNFILGDDSSAKYDNAELSDYMFTRRRVFPALMMFWSEFQHELDRIVGGLGYGIEFELELPELTDRLKTKADTAAVNANTLMALITAGASPSATVKALGLGEDWVGVADSIYRNKITSANVVALTESIDKLKRLAPENKLQNGENGGFIPDFCGKTAKDENKVSDLGGKMSKNDENGAKSGIKTLDVEFKGANYEPVWDLPADQDVKTIYDVLMKCAESLASEDENFDLEQAKADVNRMLAKAAEDGALEGAKVLESLALGPNASEGLKKLIDGGYTPSDDALKLIEERSDELLASFSEDAKEAFEKVKAEAKDEGLTQKQLNDALAEVMPKNRAETIARTEVHAAFNNGRLDLDKQMAEAYDLNIVLVWDAHIDAETCEVCRAMNGTEIKLGDAFPDHAFIETDDGEKQVGFEHSVWNQNGQSPNAHPRCRCTFNEKVVRK